MKEEQQFPIPAVGGVQELLFSSAVACIGFGTHKSTYWKWGLQHGNAKRCWNLQECGLEGVVRLFRMLVSAGIKGAHMLP